MAHELDDLDPEQERDFYQRHGGVLITKRGDVEVWDFGNHDDEATDGEEDGLPIVGFGEAHPELLGSGQGQVALLYQAAERLMGGLDIGPQGWRDCVSWGVGGAVDLRACVEAESGAGERYSWDDRVCTEALQGLAANEFNSSKGWTNSRLGTLAARDGGTVSRRTLGAYAWKRAQQWAENGLPNEHEVEALRHRARDVSRISNFYEARDAIFSGYPMAIGSNQAFLNLGRRNADGFAVPATKVEWKHCMKFVAMRDDEKPGVLCLNSWSPNSGPRGKYSDIPDGSFWVDVDTCNRMLQSGAGFAIGGFEGYPPAA